MVKIDSYNFELWHFKLGAFFESQCSYSSNTTTVTKDI